MLEQQLRDHVPLAMHPIEQAPLRVLESANMPAVLIEMGYLSNPEQEKLLAGDVSKRVRAGVYGRGRRVSATRCTDGGVALMSTRVLARSPSPSAGLALFAGAVRRPAALVRPQAENRRRRGTPPLLPRRPLRRRRARKIKARLFYVADDGTRLTGVERDVPYGEGPLEQAREIVAAQIAPVADAAGVGDSAGHHAARAVRHRDRRGLTSTSAAKSSPRIPAGRSNELLTIYTIVNALTDEPAGGDVGAAAGRRQGSRHAGRPRRPAAPAAKNLTSAGARKVTLS